MVVFHSKTLFNKFVKTTVLDSAYYFVIYLYISFLSPYLSTLGWTEIHKGWFFALFSIIGIIAAPVVGTLSDKLGRFKVILFGLVLEVVALAGYILITDPVGLFLIRIISAIGFNAVVITALSRINDTVEDESKRSRITGVAQSVVSIAVILSPFIGGYIADTMGYQQVFIVAWSIMVVVLISLMIYDMFFFTDNYEHRPKRKLKKRDFNPLKDVKDMLKFRELRAMSIIGFAANFTTPYMALVLPFVIMQKMGLDNIHISVAIFLMGLAHTLQYFFGRYADKIGSGKGSIIGITFSGSVLIAMFFAKTYIFLMILVFLRALGGALFNVSTWSYMSKIAEKNGIEGKVVGSYTAIARVAVSISFIFSGFMLATTSSAIFLIYGIIILTSVFIVGKTIIGTKIKTTIKS